MDGLDITAFVLMALMAAIVIGLFVFLGSWPGRVARRLGHPYAEAVSVAGWVTILFGGVAWPFVLIWAYAVPDVSASEALENTPHTSQES